METRLDTREQHAAANHLADVKAAPSGTASPGPPLLRPEVKAQLELEDNLLFLLANIANDEGEGKEEGGTTGLGRLGEDASSSGGSSDTQSKLPAGDEQPAAGGRRQQRQAAAQQRLRLRQRAAMEEEEEEEVADGSDSDLGGAALSDSDAPLGEQQPRARAAAAGAAAAAAAAGEGEGEEEGEGARPAKRPKPSKPPAVLGPRKYVSSQITITILEQEGCFNMTQVDAARHLGFGSSTVLKKVMRRLGIKQWPYRKRTSAKKITHSLEEYMRKYGDPAKVDAVLERVRMELAVYEASPTGSIPLRPELAALRQRLYKLDNKVKHEFKRDAEAPLRQCVHSLVEKTWQELQPTWMSDLAQQQLPGGGEAPPLAHLPPMPLPAAAEAGAGREGEGGAEGGVSDATLMLAMLLAQGVTVPPAFLVPVGGAPAPAPAPAKGTGSEASAATQQQQQQPQQQPKVEQPAPATMTPEEAEAAAKARVAALAPDLPPPAAAAAPAPVPAQA